MKRLIALFLTLALLVSCVPAALAAEDEVPEETPALLEQYEAEEETTETTETTEESTEAEPVVTEATEEATEAATEATEAATEATTEATETTEAATEATEEATEAATEATEVTEETTEATTEETTEEATEETSALLEEDEPEEVPEEEEEEQDPAMAMLKGLTTETEKAWSDAPTNVYVKQTAAKKLYISWDASRYASSFVVYEVKYNSYGEATGVKKVGATNSTSITITVSRGTHVYGIFPCSRTGGKGDLGNPVQFKVTTAAQNWRKAPTITAKQDTVNENTVVVSCKFVDDAVAYQLEIDGSIYKFNSAGAIVKEECVIKDDAPEVEISEPVIDKATFKGFTLHLTFSNMDKFTSYPVDVTGAAVGVVDSNGVRECGKQAKTIKVKMTPQWVKAPKLSAKQTSAVEPEATLTVSFSGEPDYIRFYDGKDILGDVPVDEGETSFYVTYTLSTGNHSFKAVPIAGDGDYLYGGKASATRKLKLKVSWMTDKIKVTAKETEAGKVSLSWVPMEGISEYQVWCKVGKNPEQQIGNGTTSYSYMNISGVRRGVKYTFTVKPVYNGKVGKGGSVAITPKLKTQGPTYRALLIGNTYGGDLPGCDRDANSMASLLGTMTATPYKVTKKLNASASTIKSSISSAFSGATSTDVSLFYYSGHGVSTSGSLVGNDYSTLSFSELRSALDRIPGDKIVILDSCYSGNAINKSEGEATEADMEAYVNAAMEAFSNEAMSKSGELAAGRYYVMTACRKTQTSASITEYSGESYGLFTKCFEQACGWDELNGSRLSMSADANGDGKVTLSEAYNKTDALVKQYKNSHSYLDVEQITAVNPASSDFVLFGRK